MKLADGIERNGREERMNLEETIMLMNAIHDFYPRFDINSKTMVNSWHKMLEDFDYETARKNLWNYVETDEKGVAPTIARLMKYGRTSSDVVTADRYRESMQLKYIGNGMYVDQNGYEWGYNE